MGQVLHGRATTTHAIRAAIQRSKASIQALSERHGINPKTVAKWRRRVSPEDCRLGPKVPHSTVLSAEEELLVVAFRRHTLLPLDDCLYALQATIPHLTRSSLHRLFQRQGVSRLPHAEGTRVRRKFNNYPIGYIHIDLAEVWTDEGKLYLFVAIDRVSKFAFAELHERATPRIAADFLRRLIERVPYTIHTVLTDYGFQFTPPHGGWTVAEIQQQLATHQPFRAHAFDFACAQLRIEHRLTKFKHPWTHGQVERMNRTIKDATVRRFYDDTHESLRAHLATFLDAYNCAKRLKSLRGLTPFERICQLWTEQPQRFRLNPLHHMPGLNIHADEQRRADVAAARRRWQDGLPLRDARQYVFLDESGVTTDLLRRYGRSPRGLRLRDYTPCSHWQTHTVIAALRWTGLHAPAVFDGPIDNVTFLADVEQVLVPTLHPGDVVVLDNLVVHKQPAVAGGNSSE